MASEALTRVRNRLQALVDDTKGAKPTREIVAAFREIHPDDVVEASTELQNIALTKLVDDVSRRRHKVSRSGQADLFLGFSVPGAIVVERRFGKATKRMRLSFATATFAEVKAYLKRKPETKKVTRDKGAEALLAKIEPFITSPKMTMGEAIEAMNKVQAASVAQ